VLVVVVVVVKVAERGCAGTAAIPVFIALLLPV